MLFCKRNPLDTIVDCRESEFRKEITSLHIQHSTCVREHFEFFVFTLNKNDIYILSRFFCPSIYMISAKDSKHIYVYNKQHIYDVS